jgi:hypothetical protein
VERGSGDEGLQAGPIRLHDEERARRPRRIVAGALVAGSFGGNECDATVGQVDDLRDLTPDRERPRA